ncbi:MAG: type VI secretion system baseplate subunit TssE [Burkholderiaceae bacterium]|jgi:type VI secretion system protein ImpF|nr:type VI secretion system baseplate subunit TssE [Burkholderiaceae bacterium]MDP4919944.1 type VI secretion system baseplate subunit TssE [Burkholderiaceae bacterium]
MAQLSHGGNTPLFDRLRLKGFVSTTGQSAEARLSDIEASIYKELQSLTLSRSRLSIEQFLKTARLTVLDWGLPDLTGLSAERSEDRDLCARVVVRAIEAFEPRLSKPTVEIAAFRQGRDICRFSLAAELRLGTIRERLIFNLGIDGDAV